MKLTQLKELIKQVVKEESDYQEMFKAMLDRTGKSIASMSDTEKKAFFNAVDKAATAKSEGRLKGYGDSVNEYDKRNNPKAEQPIMAKIYKLVVASNAGRISADEFLKQFEPLQKQLKSLKEAELTDKQKQIDVDKDGEIEGSDLAKLRAKNEGAQKKK